MTAYIERDGYSALLFLFCCFQLLLCVYRSPAAEHVQTTAIRTARRAQSRPHRSLRSRIRPHCKRNLLRRIIPLVVTEGDMNAVMARLEQLKTLPSDKTIILLDVGHGGFDPGSIGLDTGVREDELNLQVARFVAQKLGEKGYYVFMTRMGSYAVADTKNEDMRLRKEFMKLDIFDAVISIHMNSYPDDRSVDGTRLFYYKEGTKGQTLATIILDEICKATGQRNRGTNSGDLMVVREPVAPSALVECGFISNANEERLLANPNYQEKLAQAVADGVEKFFNSDN